MSMLAIYIVCMMKQCLNLRNNFKAGLIAVHQDTCCCLLCQK